MPTAFFTKPGTNAEREDFYHRLKTKSAAPLWEELASRFWFSPSPGPIVCRPFGVTKKCALI